ncbi:hypothetical protein SDC9_07912 [bioreactor metagenome]|uniref:Baseplate protein J-like domain-containing protein n=1 Tax=bioreactor metagenome TaxID=1076179 RepID=A0A644T695_9ZZZZ|nr:hypothetical protein [Candidatus Elulimicrobiales bacterium]
MRDIRRPYRNSKSSESEKRMSVKQDRFSRLSEREETFGQREAPLPRKKEFADIEYTREGKPMIKASSHFDVKPGGYKRERTGDEFDVLKRSEFFSNNNQREYNEENVREYRKKISKKKSGKKAFFFVFLLLVLGGLAAWTFFFNTAKLFVNPKYADIELSGSFLIFKDDIVMDYASSTLGKTVLKSEPKEVNQKASGELTIYNNYSSSSQILITNTRFQTSDGKIFRIGESVTVPGKNGNTPGTIKVKVSADTVGADYNISPTTFTIPGFKGTARYEGFYAKSTEPMSGGVSGIVQIVSQDDIDNAKADLSSSIETNIIDQASKINKKDYITLAKAPLITYSDNHNDLMLSDKNSYELTGAGTILSIKEDILAKMLTKHALGDAYNELEGVRINNPENLTFSLDKNTDLNSNIIKVDVSGATRIVWTYDEDNIRASLVNQKLSDLNSILANYSSSILSSTLSVAPGWVKKFPSSIERIRLIEEIR